MPSESDIQRLKEINNYSLYNKYTLYKMFHHSYVTSRFCAYDKTKVIDVYHFRFFNYFKHDIMIDFTEYIPQLELIIEPVYMIIRRGGFSDPQIYNEDVEHVYFIFKEDYDKDPEKHLNYYNNCNNYI